MRSCDDGDTPNKRARSTEELQALADQGRGTGRGHRGGCRRLGGAHLPGHARGGLFDGRRDRVRPHLIARHCPGVDVLFLETGYHFAETLGTRDALASVIDARIIDVLPAQTVAEQDAEYGPRLYERDPVLCRRLRKVEPINAALSGYEAWVTGIRREDSALRANAGLVEWDATHQLVKINLLVRLELRRPARLRIPVVGADQPAADRRLSSIGCEPCTRRVAPLATSGPPMGPAKTECGLHL